jgi:hemerythrin-like domain-containing protein
MIQELRSDHVNMAKLLQILERQVKVFEDGERPDWGLVQAIGAYFADYPDLCHHPKEDVIAARMLEQGLDGDSPISGLSAKHEELGALLRRFLEAVDRVLGETELPRDYFVRVAEEFIQSQRRHIEMEERYFFPVAEEMLSEADLKALEDDVPRIKDPLFGEDADERFHTLMDNILKWENA